MSNTYTVNSFNFMNGDIANIEDARIGSLDNLQDPYNKNTIVDTINSLIDHFNSNLYINSDDYTSTNPLILSGCFAGYCTDESTTIKLSVPLPKVLNTINTTVEGFNGEIMISTGGYVDNIAIGNGSTEWTQFNNIQISSDIANNAYPSIL